jgi:DNA-binding NarL/FixJ family response regulator
MSVRVLVADDQSMVRAGFRMLLAGEPDIEVVAEASDGLEAVDKAARFRPTVVLMDIRMPELDGLQATRRILAADGAARILILTTFDLDEYVYEAGSFSRTTLPNSSSLQSASLPTEMRFSHPASRDASSNSSRAFPTPRLQESSTI